MLVLTRRQDQAINIGSGIQVVVLRVQGNSVRLGILAPPDVPILRDELQAREEWTTAVKQSELAASAADTAGALS